MDTTLPSDEQLERYFQRIGYTGSASVSLATLQQLHALQPQTIAFENLNSWLGLEVSLQADKVFAKLVTGGRGGYCFEQNQLLFRVLQKLGFTVHGLSARVLWMQSAAEPLPRTHMALLVTLDTRHYLVDVGFGGLTMTAPLELHNTAEQITPHELFRVHHANDLYTVSARVADQWQALYCFSLDPSLPVDYETANWYVATHPQSRFVNQLIAGRADHIGRHSLLDTRYSRYLPDQAAQTRQVQSPDELRQLLQTEFLLELDTLATLDDKLTALFRKPL